MQSFNQSLWWVRRLSSTETSHTWYTLLHGLQYFMWGPLVKILPSDKAPAVWHRLPGSNLNQLVSSVAQSCPTLCDPMDWSTPGLPVCYQLPSLLKLMSFESVMPSNHFILCRPLLLPPSILPSIRVFSNESSPISLHQFKCHLLQEAFPDPSFLTPAQTKWLLGAPYIATSVSEPPHCW